MSLITLRWDVVDSERLDQINLRANGLYMFVMRRCGNPYYVGTAEKRSLAKRLADHRKYFADGRRTYYTDFYFGRHRDPTEHWAAPINQIDFSTAEGRARDIYVPSTGMDFDQQASLKFWRERLTIIVAPLSKPSELALVKQIERSIQYRLEDELLRAYPQMNRGHIMPAIPKVRSTLFGRREAAGPSVSFVNDWSALDESFERVRVTLDTGEGYSTLAA